jgi:DHA2 family multidrug resistance protein
VNAPYPDRARRWLITVSAMLAATMVAVDSTIANVALPHIQSTMSASAEQIIWVLTSYLIASAIATPLSGWLASRFGRKRVMLLSVTGFTLASLLCAVANNLSMLVLARAIQGISGAGLIPLSQATLLDINPPENHAKAMAIYGLGSMLGPLIGPTLGGWLTDTYSWRWVFLINLPFGILAFLGMAASLSKTRDMRPPRFDMFGFAALSIALASFQLMLDRGQQLDWFDANEVRFWAALLGVSIYLSAVHMFTRKNTFISPRMFADRNFAVGCLISATVGVVSFATIPILTVMMQSLLGYSALDTGMIGAPRAVGTLIAMIVVTRLIGRIDTKILLITGLALTGLCQWLYSRMDLSVDAHTLLVDGLLQGIGSGLIFVPLSTIVFSTLPSALRNEGTAMYALTRNIGASLGISLLQRQITQHQALAQSRLAEAVRPDSPMLQWRMPGFDIGSNATIAQLTGLISRQASMIAYVDVYQLLALISFCMLPTIFLMRSPRRSAPRPAVMAME